MVPAANQSRGFTLIELMIVVAVVALLAAVAWPSYHDHVMRSHRANARAALLQTAQWLERAATAQGRYPLEAAIPAGVQVVEGGRYRVVVESRNGTNYRLMAVPVGQQASDRCGSYELNEAGTRSQRPTAEVPQPLDSPACWNR